MHWGVPQHEGGQGGLSREQGPPGALGLRSPFQTGNVFQLSLSVDRRWGSSAEGISKSHQEMEPYSVSTHRLFQRQHWSEDWSSVWRSTGRSKTFRDSQKHEDRTHRSACHGEEDNTGCHLPFVQSPVWRTGLGYWDTWELCTVSSPVATSCGKTTVTINWRTVQTLPKHTYLQNSEATKGSLTRIK